jgi:ABC-2 type transport system ATP-binding protein
VKAVERVDRQLIISVDDPERQNPILVERIVAAGGGIQFVNELHHSLEDIYFALMDEGSQGGEA